MADIIPVTAYISDKINSVDRWRGFFIFFVNC